MVIVEGGTGDLCKEKVDGIEAIGEDMYWFICIV